MTHASRIRLVPKHPEHWGAWKLDTCDMTLNHDHVPNYQIDLETMNTAGAMLDWIMQVSAKRWMTSQDKDDLLEALREIFNPQENLCSWAIHAGRTNMPSMTQEINARQFLREKYRK